MFSFLAIVVFYSCMLSEASTQSNDLIVQLPEGLIQGHTLKSWSGNYYYAFQEIPYAAPPIGKLRFKEPTPPPAWDGILNTTQNIKQCPQTIIINPTLTETEDCLYINVYSPQQPVTDILLPVFIFIHGGGFYAGSGTYSQFNPSGFMDHNIVVVGFNYRLGPLGFLYTGDDVIPGNLGLKDQVFAFQWVKSNIHLFGGNPEQITIGGESAGAISVGFHLVSNAQGLYSAAIQQSGSSLAYSCNAPHPRENAFRLGRALNPNFNSENSTELLNLLQQASTEEIKTADAQVVPYDPNTTGYFTRLKWLPVIENSPGEDSLISYPMAESFNNGNFHQVPVLLGFNSEEALGVYDESLDFLADEYDRNPGLLADKALNIPDEYADLFGSELISIYTDSNFSNDKAALVKFTSDAVFTRSMMRQAELSSQYVPVYFYVFSYLGNVSAPNRYIVAGAEGAEHGEELYYMCVSIPLKTEADLITSMRVILMWSNFIKYLNPIPETNELFNNVTWPNVQYGSSDFQYLDINATLSVKTNPRSYQQLRSLLEQYQQPPFVVV